MSPKYQYYIHIGGDFFNDEHKQKHGLDPGSFFFDTAKERAEFRKKYEDAEEMFGCDTIRFDEAEGFDVIYRTIAEMDLEYGGKTYPIKYDFGHNYTTDGAEYMFTEGNYSCDCNLSIFIRERYGQVIPELPCGEEIKMSNLKITREL